MSLSRLVDAHRPDLTPYEQLYKHFHSNPELSNQEKETASTIAAHLRNISPDFDIRTNIGGHGIAAILRNGAGPTVLSRADMDALPIEEKTKLPYASTKRALDLSGHEQPVMHACGHDMHMTAHLGYAELMVSARHHWHGTLVLIFQPAEERGTGAQAMVNSGLYSASHHAIPTPTIIISGHVTPSRSGTLSLRPGPMASSCDNFRITFHGRGGHASTPASLIDPIIMASSAVLRLQTLVSRETHPSHHAVLTCSGIYSGTPTAENVVADTAVLTVDIRANDPLTRDRLIEGVHRIVRAESAASNAPVEPSIVRTRSFPVTVNDEAATERVGGAFRAHFGGDFTPNCPMLGFSEDFCNLATAVDRPALLFAYGGTSGEVFDRAQREGRLSELPGNHSAGFELEVTPTLRVGVDAYALCALSWVADHQGQNGRSKL